MPHANVWYSLAMTARHDAYELHLDEVGAFIVYGPLRAHAMWYWMGR